MIRPSAAHQEFPSYANDPDIQLATRHAPVLCFDSNEPFLPEAVGITVFHEDGPSPSFSYPVRLPPGATTAIEYAIWWDWDIQHLYELEHIWLYLDAEERLVAADASWHGTWHPMHDEAGALPLSENGHLRLHSEPGKHAFAANWADLAENRPQTLLACSSKAGALGLHVNSFFEKRIRPLRTPDHIQLAHTWLEDHHFTPSFDFSRELGLSSLPLVPWPKLANWIPWRINAWFIYLEGRYPRGRRRVLRIGHRGASALEPENTLAAFSRAAELGCDMVEMDLRVTADHVPVILHDDSLRRTFGLSRPIRDLTWEEVRQQAPDLPSLEEAIATCREGGLKLYLEIKFITPQGGIRTLEILRENDFLHRTVIASFRVDWLAALKRECPEVFTSVIFSFANVDAVSLAKAVGAEYVHPCWDYEPNNLELMTQEWIDRAHEAGLGVIGWVQQSRESAKELREKGMHALTADDPNFLLE
ncbi:MAG: glycerophosphodiester phosphodiesterase [Chloroflexi bacterium]|nr:glycerophosphodiester phosphodiesterase [Chloroflexota bacterium]